MRYNWELPEMLSEAIKTSEIEGEFLSRQDVISSIRKGTQAIKSIHPFEDGNGRIGRVIAEKALSQTLGRPMMMGLSQSIEADKKMYYAALEAEGGGRSVRYKLVL